MKQIQLIGHLGKDANATKKNDSYVINFNLAVSTKYKDSEGVEISETDWFSVFLRRKQAKNILPYLKKGSRVFVQGSPTMKVTKSDGKDYLNLTVNCDKLDLLGSSKDK